MMAIYELLYKHLNKQTPLSRIWTLITESISYDDNRYSKRAFFIFTELMSFIKLRLAQG